MKKQTNEQLRGGCLEAVGELVLYLIFFGLGLLVVGLFGGNTALDEVDPDLMVLLGILALGIVAAVVFGLIKLLKRKKRNASAVQIETDETVTEHADQDEDSN